MPGGYACYAVTALQSLSAVIRAWNKLKFVLHTTLSFSSPFPSCFSCSLSSCLPSVPRLFYFSWPYKLPFSQSLKQVLPKRALLVSLLKKSTSRVHEFWGHFRQIHCDSITPYLWVMNLAVHVSYTHLLQFRKFALHTFTFLYYTLPVACIFCVAKHGIL